MRKKDQNAIAYPGNYVPNTPFPEVEPPRHTVVQADNKVSPPQVLALAFAVLFVMASVVVWALWDLTGWSVAVVTVIVTPAIGYAGFWLFVFANGDGLAWREITKNAQNQETAILEHAALLREGEDHRHVEAMRGLDIQSQQVAIDGQLRALTMEIEGIKRNLLTVAERPATVTPAKFVEADPIHAAAKTTAINYAVSLYEQPNRGGAPHPHRVQLEGNQPGRIKGETPFSKRGRWPDGVTPEVGKRAAEMLFRPDNGQPPVIVEVANGYGINLDAYPTRQMVWQKFA